MQRVKSTLYLSGCWMPSWDEWRWKEGERALMRLQPHARARSSPGPRSRHAPPRGLAPDPRHRNCDRMESMIVAGIDGTRTGWILALLHFEKGASSGASKQSRAQRAPHTRVTLHHLASLSQLAGLEASMKPRFVAIDMPLGLSSHAERGGRACDRAARAVLAAAASASRGVKCKRSEGTVSDS